MQEYKTSIDPHTSRAIIIGNSNYANLEDIKECKKSANRIVEILKDNNFSDFLPENVFPVINKTRTVITDNLSEICGKCEDTLFVYYCGHGLYDDDSMLILTGTDTKHETRTTSGILWNVFKNIIEESRAKNKIIILDCCHSGLAIMGNKNEDYNIHGTYLITATKGAKTTSTKGFDGFTQFSSVIIDILTSGIPTNSYALTVENIWRELNRKRKGQDLAISPDRAILGTPNELRIVYNRKYRPKAVLQSSAHEDTELRERIFNYIENTFEISPAAMLPSVLIIKVATKHPVKHEDFGVPLGPWSLKSYLSSYGYCVEIFDERLNSIKQQSNIDIKSVINCHDIIGFSVCSCEIPRALELAKIAHLLGKKTVFGGIFTRSNELYLLNHNQVDFVIPGVATYPFLTLLESLKRYSGKLMHTVKGLYSRELMESDAVTEWESESLPFINNSTYSELITSYQEHLGDKIDIVTGRGCANTCKFCSVSKETTKRSIRAEAQVVNEIARHYEAGFKRISIKDENFIDQTARVKRIFSGCSELGLPIEFKIKSRIDDLFSEKNLLPQLRDWGVKEIQFGVEALSQGQIEMIDKGYEYKQEEIEQFFRTIMGYGITVNASFVLSIPFENRRHHDRLFEFINKFSDNFDLLKPYINFYTPHPFSNNISVPYESKLMVNDLNCFNHKNPIIAPKRWGKNEKESMLNCYHAIGELHDYKKYNPTVSSENTDRYIDGSMIKDLNIPSYV